MERYFRYEAAGDQFAGRVVCGLPVNSANFAILPPHFPNLDDPILLSALEMSFPTLVKLPNLHGVLCLVLASLVYHFEHLHSKMPINHPLHSTPIFVHADIRIYLLSILESGTDSCYLRASGVPPHIELYKKLDQTQSSISTLPRLIVNELREIIEQNGVMAGNITQGFLETTISKAIADIVGRTGIQNNTQSSCAAESSIEHQIYYWGDGMHLLPESFKFPSVEISVAWKLWWRGNPTEKILPYRKIKTIDLADKKQRNIFYDWKFIMEKLYNYYKRETGLELASTPTEIELIRSFQVVQTMLLPTQKETPQKRQRHDSQLATLTVVRHFREHQKQNLSRTHT
ncbi:hypothetical protein Ae201684P_016791 [Aphanomyces euteiches]|uniref:Uncharacterized protein n=2 Tax=Aphanomyces euteiches TaxID=100861 RepID=A0A6G0XID5_9STRA|nr:hypothetical protein Ae201684_004550 [Aphanomyces euteiches]KAH9094179.1 hypothetical protein Ae201684P_016791 [Aphanomyces euteiches]